MSDDEDYSSSMNSFENSNVNDVSALKSQIFSLAASVDRGFGAKQADREEIITLINQLKSLNPYSIPTMGLTNGKFMCYI